MEKKKKEKKKKKKMEKKMEGNNIYNIINLKINIYNIY